MQAAQAVQAVQAEERPGIVGPRGEKLQRLSGAKMCQVWATHSKWISHRGQAVPESLHVFAGYALTSRSNMVLRQREAVNKGSQGCFLRFSVTHWFLHCSCQSVQTATIITI